MKVSAEWAASSAEKVIGTTSKLPSPPQSLEVTVGRINMLTPARAQDISRIRDEGQDDEASVFVEGWHSRVSVRRAPDARGARRQSPDSSDYLLIHARIELGTPVPKLEVQRRPEEPYQAKHRQSRWTVLWRRESP